MPIYRRLHYSEEKLQKSQRIKYVKAIIMLSLLNR